jgi:Galactose oxidase, central domain
MRYFLVLALAGCLVAFVLQLVGCEAASVEPALGVTHAELLSATLWTPTADPPATVGAPQLLTVHGQETVLALNIHSSFLYDVATAAWSSAGEPLGWPNPSAVLADGRVLGFDMDGISYLFDPASESWSYARDASGALSYVPGVQRWPPPATLTALADGRALAAGGDSSAIFDPMAQSWGATTDSSGHATQMVVPRSGHTATLLSDGTVLVAGGRAWPGGTTVLASSEIFDPKTGLWSATGSLNDARWGHIAAPLDSGQVLVAGGGPTTSERYDAASRTWQLTLGAPTVYAAYGALIRPSGVVLVMSQTSGAASVYVPLIDGWLTSETFPGGSPAWGPIALGDDRALVSNERVTEILQVGCTGAFTCPSGFECLYDVCLVATGGACTSDTSCASGRCVAAQSGSRCATLPSCPPCSVVNDDGSQCLPAIAGSDPKSDCAAATECQGHSCDGAGACRVVEPANTVCSNPSCAGDLYSFSVCDGISPVCPSPTPVPCPNHVACREGTCRIALWPLLSCPPFLHALRDGLHLRQSHLRRDVSARRHLQQRVAVRQRPLRGQERRQPHLRERLLRAL